MTAAEGPHPQKTGRAACARGQAPTNCWEAGDRGEGHPVPPSTLHAGPGRGAAAAGWPAGALGHSGPHPSLAAPGPRTRKRLHWRARAWSDDPGSLVPPKA